jgi:hypothetical protein
MNVGELQVEAADPLKSKLQIRLVGTQKPKLDHPLVEFDPAIPLERCDGMLAWLKPSVEFLAFRGVRAWYIDEPLNVSIFRTRLFREALKTVPETEFLHHSNRNPSYRFPCVTHWGEPTVANRQDRRKAVVAVVSNFGGRIWWLRAGVRFRNKFLLDPNVELFGSLDSWRRFRRYPWSAPRQPENYKGPFDGNWFLESQVEALSQYSVNLCIENTLMPYYFTEKFVNAARAGCVPIYHAHPTVRENFLKGARWIDPSDFAFSVRDTISAALDCDAREFRENNWNWLRTEQVAATEGSGMWNKIADLFVSRIAPDLVIPI